MASRQSDKELPCHWQMLLKLMVEKTFTFTKWLLLLDKCFHLLEISSKSQFCYFQLISNISVLKIVC